MRVTERLASLFVQENLEDRELLADQTNQFLQASARGSPARLLEHEKKLAGVPPAEQRPAARPDSVEPAR